MSRTKHARKPREERPTYSALVTRVKRLEAALRAVEAELGPTICKPTFEGSHKACPICRVMVRIERVLR